MTDWRSLLTRHGDGSEPTKVALRPYVPVIALEES